MANVPPNDPNVDASTIVHVPVNPNNAPAQPVGLENGFVPHWIRDNIPNNQNGWIKEGAKEEEEDPEEDLEEEPKDDDDDMEMDDEAEVIDPYMDDGSNNPPPPNSEDEETPPTSPVIPDAAGQPIPPIASFGQNFHLGESSSTTNLLTGNSKIVPTGPMCLNLETAWKSPITFRGNEGAVGLIRWIEKTKMVFTVEMKVMMMEEFCPPEEIQRMDYELWNLRVKEMDISSYTTRFNELVILCPGMVPTERKKVEAYIRGLSKNIKGEVTSSELATLNKAVRMAHTLMEQKVKAIAEREANNKKRKCENFQGGSSSGCGNNNSNRNNNDYPINHHSYEVELADGRVVSIDTILRGCALNLVNHLFEIDLMPIELGTFDVIIGMDWLILHDAVIVCGKKERRHILLQEMLSRILNRKREVDHESEMAFELLRFTRSQLKE
nr:hypothetical protein [Tanacetum cinerariifolium]